MVVTLSGRVISFSDTAISKVLSAIAVIAPSKMKLSSLEFPAKALSPIDLTLLPSSTLVRDLQLLNA